ncbi:MAG: 4-(cytidine 5'-diphospho)-2-C-methyl-D-erythritol kinase [Dermatophilaceae bacterium]
MTTPGRPASVSARVPAKINLELLVGPKRDDGYHDLSTVFHAVSLTDEVTVTPAADWSVSLSGPLTAGVPVDDDNVALKAARLLAERATRTHGRHGSGRIGPVHVHIDKEIPVAGGMAGGSGDAAAALIACDVLWGTSVGRDELGACAALLGSDVNFALTGGTAIGSGRGENVTPVLAQGRYHWVLVLSDEGLQTGSVFAECDRLRERAARRPARDPGTAGRGGLRVVPDCPESPDSRGTANAVAAPDADEAPPGALEPGAEMMQALRGGDTKALAAALRNDLQEAAISLRPALGDILAAGLEYGALGGVVSGSGPTVAFLVTGPEGALDLAVALMASGTATQVLRAIGPAHGAHVVPEPRSR